MRLTALRSLLLAATNSSKLMKPSLLESTSFITPSISSSLEEDLRMALSSDFDIFPSPLVSNLRNTSSSSKRPGRVAHCTSEAEFRMRRAALRFLELASTNSSKLMNPSLLESTSFITPSISASEIRALSSLILSSPLVSNLRNTSSSSRRLDMGSVTARKSFLVSLLIFVSVTMAASVDVGATNTPVSGLTLGFYRKTCPQAEISGLTLGFYRKTCPQAEIIVRDTVAKYMSRAPSLAAPLLRMHFHDCFVRGCDASVLLNTTNSNQPAEKDAIPNQTLRGFQVIDAAKAELEKQCPAVVSCADILALVARDAVDMLGGPRWTVPTGRRDGVVSILNEALANLPRFFANLERLKSSFASKGLNVKDLVVLSGAHTIGTSQCRVFSNRIYNFTANVDVDPSFDKLYAQHLKIKCKPGENGSKIVEMDPGSFRTFDNHYYVNLKKRRGLFGSDVALLTDPTTMALVNSAAMDSTWFLLEFGRSMEKMGRIGVLTGNEGQIRRQCALVN